MGQNVVSGGDWTFAASRAGRIERISFSYLGFEQESTCCHLQHLESFKKCRCLFCFSGG